MACSKYADSPNIQRKQTPVRVESQLQGTNGNATIHVEAENVYGNFGTGGQLNMSGATAERKYDCFMKEPMCVITTETDGKLVYIEETIAVLRKIDMPIVSITVVGPYRSGKSYLMNKLVFYRQKWKELMEAKSAERGFAVGHAMDSQTKGIWIWAVPHPIKENTCLVIMDTEGLGDAKKGDEAHDHKIFALAILNSSHLIFNTRGVIEQRHIDMLEFVTNITDHIHLKAKSSNSHSEVHSRHSEDDEEFDDDDEDNGDEEDWQKVSPMFTWVLRDVTCQLIVRNRQVSTDEYLAYCLEEQKAPSGRLVSAKRQQETQAYNIPRQQIKNFFQNRKCFAIVPPSLVGNCLDGSNTLNASTEDDVDRNFLIGIDNCCNYILESSDVKSVVTENKKEQMKGRGFANMLIALVEQMSHPGSVPCLENAVKTMEELSNKRAIEEALVFYNGKMKEASLPTKPSSLQKIHIDCRVKAEVIFGKNKMFDRDNLYLDQLKERIEEQFTKQMGDNKDKANQKARENIKKSVEHYSNLLGGCIDNKPLAPWEFSEEETSAMKKATKLFASLTEEFDENGDIFKAHQRNLHDALQKEKCVMDEKYQQKDLKTEAEFNTKVKQLTEQYKQEMEKLMDITHHLAVKDDDLSKHHTTLKNAKREELQAITKGFYKQTDIVNFLEKKIDKAYEAFQKENTIRVLKQTNEEQSKKIDDTIDQLNVTREIAHKTEKKLEETKEEVTHQQKMLKDYEVKVKETTEQLAQTQEQVDTTTHELTTTKQEMREAKEKLEDTLNDVADLQAQIDELRKKQVSFLMKNQKTGDFLTLDKSGKVCMLKKIEKSEPRNQWYLVGDKIMNLHSRTALTIDFPKIKTEKIQSKYELCLLEEESEYQLWEIKSDTSHTIQSKIRHHGEIWSLRASEKKLSAAAEAVENLNRKAYAEQKKRLSGMQHWIVLPTLA